MSMYGYLNSPPCKPELMKAIKVSLVSSICCFNTATKALSDAKVYTMKYLLKSRLWREGAFAIKFLILVKETPCCLPH